MKALFGALESVDEYGKSTDELELEYHEALFEYEEVAAELDEIFEEENEIITAVEQIENLITTIEEHGLSKGMVATINILEPELSEHGIISSTEADSEVIRKLKAVISNEAISKNTGGLIAFGTGGVGALGFYVILLKVIETLSKLNRIIKKVITKYLVFFKSVTNINEAKLNKVKIKYFNDTNVCNMATPASSIIFKSSIDNINELEKLSDSLAKFNTVDDYVENGDKDKFTQQFEKLINNYKAVLTNSKVTDFLGEIIIPNEANKFKLKFIKDTKFKTTKIPLGDIIKTPKEAISLLNETKDLGKQLEKNDTLRKQYQQIYLDLKTISKIIKKSKKNKAGKKAINKTLNTVSYLFVADMKVVSRLNIRLAKVIKMNMAICKQLYKCRQK